MTTNRAVLATTALLLMTGLAGVLDRPVLAQNRSRYHIPNSYEDFPYNQGSLFYAPRGANATTRRGTTTRTRPPLLRRPTTRGTYVYPPRTYYYQPGTYRPY